MEQEISLSEYQELTKPKHKYFAKKTEVDAIWFDSKKEAARYLQLKILERSGYIRNLKLQPEFPIIVNGKKICTWIGDFSYYDMRKAESVVEDCKGVRTAVYRLKKKLFEALYERTITET